MDHYLLMLFESTKSEIFINILLAIYVPRLPLVHHCWKFIRLRPQQSKKPHLFRSCIISIMYKKKILRQILEVLQAILQTGFLNKQKKNIISM